MLLRRLFRSEPLINSGKLLLNARLCLFSAAWMHLIFAAVVILPIDMSGDEDPKVRAYSRLKWKFITAWFNFISLTYLPVCLYCDWKESRGEAHQTLVCQLRRIRDVVFTSVLFPTVMFADLAFWRLYLQDPSLIAPLRLFQYLPAWGQHSLHTISLLVVVLDLLLVPRQKPYNLMPRLILMTTFVSVYVLVVLESYYRGEAVYQMLENLSKSQVILAIVQLYLEYLFQFFVQWFVIDFVWKKRTEKKIL